MPFDERDLYTGLAARQVGCGDVVAVLLRENEQLTLRLELRAPVPDTFLARLEQDLLREFQRRKTHMAIVVDEYGGVAGMVTIEDVLEQIVGEIEHEHDMQERKYEKMLDKRGIRTLMVPLKTEQGGQDNETTDW